jgi:hypothetical protein
VSYFIRIFGRSDAPLLRAEIADFISEGLFFDRPPRFDPPIESDPDGGESWSAFSVHYDPERRPIRLEHNFNDAIVAEELKELVFVLEKSQDTSARDEVLRVLDSVRQVVSLEINRETVSDDGWEMLDALEAFVAERIDGIVYAPDGGFFDKNLRPLYRL